MWKISEIAKNSFPQKKKKGPQAEKGTTKIVFFLQYKQKGNAQQERKHISDVLKKIKSQIRCVTK